MNATLLFKIEFNEYWHYFSIEEWEESKKQAENNAYNKWLNLDKVFNFDYSVEQAHKLSMVEANVRIVRVRQGAVLPTYAHGPEEDAGMDLSYCGEEVITLHPGDWRAGGGSRPE